MRTLAGTLQVMNYSTRHDESCFHNRHDQAVVAHRACAIQRASLFTAMGRVVTPLCLLSIAFFRCNFADPLVMLYGASAIGRGAENAAGEISARDTNGSIACIGNYSNSTGCS